jgi:hypothetical protein
MYFLYDENRKIIYFFDEESKKNENFVHIYININIFAQ